MRGRSIDLDGGGGGGAGTAENIFQKCFKIDVHLLPPFLPRRLTARHECLHATPPAPVAAPLTSAPG